MKRASFISVSFLIIAFLAGCSQTPSEGPVGKKSVSWYEHHTKALNKELGWCKKQADRSKRPGCENVNSALQNEANQAMFGTSSNPGEISHGGISKSVANAL